MSSSETWTLVCIAADLKCIYRAVTAERAEAALADFRHKYPKHQVVADMWERNWQRVMLVGLQLRASTIS